MKEILLLLTHVGILVLLASIHRSRQKNTLLRSVYWPALLLKISAGITFGWFYLDYMGGTGDTLKYWSYLEGSPEERAQILDPTREPRVAVFLKPLEFLHFFTGNNYYLFASYLSFFSFFGAFSLVKVLAMFFKKMTLPAIIAFLFWPSVVFWTSGLNKESIAIGLLFFLMAQFLQWTLYKENLLGRLLLLCGGLWYLALLKYYYAGAFLGCGFAYLLVDGLVKRWSMKWALLFMVFLVGGFVLASFIHPNLNMNQIGAALEQNNRDMLAASDPHKARNVDGLTSDPRYWVAQAPAGVLHGVFAPLPWQSWNTRSLLASLENLMVLIFLLLGIVGLRKAGKVSWTYVVTLLFWLLIMATFIGLATPNYGTLARYKTSYLPFLVMLSIRGLFLLVENWKPTPIDKEKESHDPRIQHDPNT